MRSLMQSFLRMQDPLRIIRFGIEHPEGDGRGQLESIGNTELPAVPKLKSDMVISYAITHCIGVMGLNMFTCSYIS